TPSSCPVPNLSPLAEKRLAIPYPMNEAAVAPPGVIPIQQPMAELRINVSQYLGSFFHVCHTTVGLILACLPSNASPSSMVSRISPRPNRPMTTIRKSIPRSNSYQPKVMRSSPLTVSMPTAASPKPSIIEMMVLAGVLVSAPTKLQKVSRKTAKNSGGPNLSANFETRGARNVISRTPTKAPMKDPVNDAVSASAARPCWASGQPSQVVATADVSPGILNRIEVMAP